VTVVGQRRPPFVALSSSTSACVMGMRVVGRRRPTLVRLLATSSVQRLAAAPPAAP
jgi:hypothetical protein